MKASELRIGNFVTIYNEEFWPELIGVPMSVVAINYKEDKNYPDSQHSISVFNLLNFKEYSQFNQFAHPIPLTEEWLLKLGLPNDGYGYFLQNDSSYSLSEKIGDATTVYLGSCKYVHQLQNLYFALTGEELELIK